jgi:hypothetical protein
LLDEVWYQIHSCRQTKLISDTVLQAEQIACTECYYFPPPISYLPHLECFQLVEMIRKCNVGLGLSLSESLMRQSCITNFIPHTFSIPSQIQCIQCIIFLYLVIMFHISVRMLYLLKFIPQFSASVVKIRINIHILYLPVVTICITQP